MIKLTWRGKNYVEEYDKIRESQCQRAQKDNTKRGINKNTRK
jgi:hypothetical protein